MGTPSLFALFLCNKYNKLLYSLYNIYRDISTTAIDMILLGGYNRNMKRTEPFTQMLTVRFPPELFAWIKQDAQVEQRSLNGEILYILWQYMLCKQEKDGGTKRCRTTSDSGF